MGYSPWRPKQSDTTEDSALHTRNSVFTGLEMGLLILPNYYFCHILEKPGNFQTCLEKETVASVDCFFLTKSHRDPLEGEHPMSPVLMWFRFWNTVASSRASPPYSPETKQDQSLAE